MSNSGTVHPLYIPPLYKETWRYRGLPTRTKTREADAMLQRLTKPGSIHPDIDMWRTEFNPPPHIVVAENAALLTPEDMERLRKDRSIRVGVTASCFDLLHAGHGLMLEDAKRHCDFLVTLLQTDPTIDRADTKAPPVQSLHARFTELRLNRNVDKIVLYDTESELSEFLEQHARVNSGFIDVRIIGEDYVGKDFTGMHAPIELMYNWRKHDYSTTRLRDHVVAAEPRRQAMRKRPKGATAVPFRAAAAPAR